MYLQECLELLGVHQEVAGGQHKEEMVWKPGTCHGETQVSACMGPMAGVCHRSNDAAKSHVDRIQSADLLYTICTLAVPKVSTEKPALSPYVEREQRRPTVGKEGT